MADTPPDTRTELSGKRAPAPGATRHAPADTGPDAPHKTRADGPVGLNGRSGRDVPASPADLQGSSWLTAAKRTLHEFADDALVALALWSASGYIAAFMRAANVVYDVPEGRPFWKTTPLRVGVTLLIMVMLVVSALMVVVTGGLANHVGQVLGIGPAAVTVWNIAKWPVLLIIISLMISTLYWVAPNAKRGFQWVSPGGVLAVIVWLIASGLFAFYVANFANYNKTYGSIAGVIIFLAWL